MNRRRSDIALAAALLALALFPLAGSTFYLQLVTKIMAMAIFAMSLDLLVGYTGLVSLGHAAFFGIAGYTLALLSPQYEAANLWTTLPAAMAACAMFALVTGALVLRTSGIYFIMVTLAFAQMAYFVFHDTALGGGSDGIYIYVKPEMKLAGRTLLDLGDLGQFYDLVLILMTAVYLFLRRLLGSPFGRALAGIRANEQRMRSLGFPTFRYKLAAYVIAGALAGISGYLAALQFGFVNPEILSWHNSGIVLMMVILGGMGTLHGAIIGAFALVLLQEVLANQAWFGEAAKHWQLAMGVLIVLVALFLPRGLAGLGARPRKASADGR
ncbi:MAG TPA: branched-chain amino acid ABC transporter permease [Rhodocyclaceae bacterium]|nr:MAG: branched-chain amino acid ABC transporter permease [Betaproteobacteria bacterium CG2_30_68_42]HCX32206.1 branched-chain amino acid ABC transporter permease [Rhodocyclaceae bacterium]